MERQQLPVDLASIFNQRVESIKPFPDETTEGAFVAGSEIGRQRLRKRVIVIVFMMGQDNSDQLEPESTGLWMELPDTFPKNKYPHKHTEDKFKEFVKPFGFNGHKWMGGWLLATDAGKRHLVLDPDGSQRILVNQEYSIRNFLATWEKIIDNYQLESVVLDKHVVAGHKFDGVNSVIDSDLIWRLRAGPVVSEIAMREGMTNSQFLRFWQLTVNDKERKQQGSWDQIAKRVIEFDF